MACACAQHLLGRPQRIAPARCSHHYQMLEPHTGGGQRRGVRQMRRRQPGDALAAGAQRSERGQHQAQFSHALARSKDFGERACRPAAARQFAIEQREACRQRPGFGSNGSAAAPDGLPPENVIEGCHGYCIFIQLPGGAQEGYPAQRFTDFRMRSSEKPSLASTGARSKISP